MVHGYNQAPDIYILILWFAWYISLILIEKHTNNRECNAKHANS